MLKRYAVSRRVHADLTTYVMRQFLIKRLYWRKEQLEKLEKKEHSFAVCLR